MAFGGKHVTSFIRYPSHCAIRMNCKQVFVRESNLYPVLCNECFPILSWMVSLTNEKVVSNRNPTNLSIIWPSEHTVGYNTILITYPYYAVHILKLSEYHQHEVGMFLGFHTRLFSQQACTRHGIVGHSKTRWRCNTGMYTRGLCDTMGICIVLAVTIKAIQWSIGVSLLTHFCSSHERIKSIQTYITLSTPWLLISQISIHPKYMNIRKMLIFMQLLLRRKYAGSLCRITGCSVKNIYIHIYIYIHIL